MLVNQLEAFELRRGVALAASERSSGHSRPHLASKDEAIKKLTDVDCRFDQAEPEGR